MILSTGNKRRKFIVHFDHGTEIVHFDHGTEVESLQYTSCQIKDIRTKDTIAAGEANLVQGDRFNKKIGRKIALTRALKNLNIPRHARRQMWRSYFAICPIKKGR